tara:strand:- start:1937 stop:2410 length:474 start_codon:yes stop_codon:yes gene_type:complete
MGKAKPHPEQIAFAFDAPKPATLPASLAGLEQRICRTVGSLLASDTRSREVIAAEMTVLLDEDVSRAMLDAYASPARTEHKVPMSRFFALVAVVNRLDLFDPLVREIGGALLEGPEALTAQVGHLTRVIAEAKAELRKIERIAPTIRTGGKHGKPRA